MLGSPHPANRKETALALYQITEIRTEQPYGASHEHIAYVRLNHGTTAYSRATVIADLRSPNGDRYYTDGGGVTARVFVAGCPSCTFRDDITTEPDWTTTNNLLSLPRF